MSGTHDACNAESLAPLADCISVYCSEHAPLRSSGPVTELRRARALARAAIAICVAAFLRAATSTAPSLSMRMRRAM